MFVGISKSSHSTQGTVKETQGIMDDFMEFINGSF